MPTLVTIHRYPFKSAAAETLARADVESRGLVGDRRWMAVDADHRFITGRQHPRMPLIRATLDGDELCLETDGLGALRISPAQLGERGEVTIWNDQISVRIGCDAADERLSRFLGQSARLVHLDDATQRPVDPDYARSGDQVSLADGYPLLLISQASLDGLNERLADPVPMLRFRPNLVVTADTPHAEDNWKRIRIGDVEFDVVKPCTRCVFTTVDPERGERDPSGEPLRTLLGYRRTPSGATFGQNLIPRDNGVIRAGDVVEIVD